MRPGIVLLALFMTGIYLTVYGRTVLQSGGPPAFFLERRDGVTVLLGEGFPEPGIHQFYDGATVNDVIEMTLPDSALYLDENDGRDAPLLSGETLSLLLRDDEVVEIERKWMRASHRMALGIPLHPDRMSLEDWPALPGIGPRLALRIENDRQRNGEFGSFEGLGRVSGVGPGRLDSWREFFLVREVAVKQKEILQ